VQDQIGEMKIKYNTPEIVKDLPPHFLSFMKHLKTLNYADRPDYNLIQSLLSELYHSIGCDEHTPFDWEVNAAPSHTSSSLNRSATSTPAPIMSTPVASGESQQNNNNAPNNAHHGSSPATQRVHEGNKPVGTDDVDPHSEGHSHPSKRESSNNNNQSEGSGSWNQKSSPREKGGSREADNNSGNARQSDVHIKIMEKENSSPREHDNQRPPSGMPQNSSKHKKPALCAKCTIL
jgi:hypothetical protein